MIIYSFDQFLLVMDGICANNLFQASIFSKDYNRKWIKRFFSSVLLGFLSDLLMSERMLPTMLYLVYHFVVGGAVVFNLIGRLSESAL